MNAFTYSFLFVAVCMLVALGGVLVVRRLVPAQSLTAHHEVAGYLLSIVGTLYAVLLGLIVVDVQSKYQEAKMMAECEANAVADVYHMVQGFPEIVRKPIQDNLYQYVLIVLDQDWSAPPTNDGFTRSVEPLRNVWKEMVNFEPKTNREQALYSAAVQVLGQLSDSRRYRMVTGSSGLSPVLWTVLVGGGFLTIVFTYFFGVQSLRAQMLMTGIVVMALALNVLLVLLFGNPYRGQLKIEPRGFKFDKVMMERLSVEQPYLKK